MDFSALPQQLSAAPHLALPLVFLAGVLTSLTPCIYPMIPITAAIVGGQSGSATGARPPRSRVLALTLSYVTGLAAVYAALGLFAGLTGSMFGTVSTNPWLYLLMANLLLVAGLAMLDVIPIRPPQSWMKRAAELDTRGRVVGALAMGAASGLVAAPCGAPVMAAVLTWVGVSGSAVMGFVYLFAFSLGMSMLLVVVGLSVGAAARLPRPGVWMLWVKRGFAVVMIVAAQYYLVQMGMLLI